MSKKVTLDNSVVYPYALRNSTFTSSTTMSDGVLGDKSVLNRETKFIDADSGAYLDLLMVSGVNSSDQAIRLSIYENFGGTSQFKVQMAASSSTQLFFQVPFNASAKANAWWADYDVYGGVTNADDVTNTVVSLTAQYIKRI